MMLRTPAPRKRRVESQLEEGDNIIHNPKTPNSNNQFLIYEDLPLAQHFHGHSEPTTSDSMLCTYQCRQMVKSDFFEALSSAEKQARDYQSKFEALTDDFSKTESERKKFRDQFLNMEQELAAAKGREHMLQEQLKKEVDLSHERLRTQIQSYNELEIKFQNEIDLRTKAELSAAKSEEKASLIEGKLGTLSESTTREKNRLQTVLEQLRSESKLSVSRIRADLERMECRAEGAEKELALLKEQSQELKKQLDECMREKFEMEKKLSTPSMEAPSKDSDILVKLLQEELRNFESEVSEARKIKASHENVAMLKEKLHEEKSRRERAELNLFKLSDLQTNVSNLDDELSKWKSLINTIPGVSIADDIPLKFAALQKEVVDSINKAGEAQAGMKKHQVAVENAMVDKQNAETEAAMAKEKEKSYKAEIGRLEMMLASTVAERDHLKNVVKELTKSEHVEGGTELVSRSVVQELEASLARKENYVRELESSLLEQKEVNNSNHNEIRLLNERLLNEKERVKYLEREGDRLERECAHFRSEISRLEAKLGRGDYSSSNTQVLRMVNTLAVENEAKKTIEALQNELQKTKEKLQAVDELKKQSPDAGTHVDSYIAAKIKQLKEQIATLEKREERYKTVFAERISVFRRACCELFGYKIVMDDHQRADGISVTRFTLHSIYAMSDDEKLQFEYESGNTSIVANAYTSHREISQQVEIFIKKMNSIPAFTANLTVESFNRRTLS